MVRHHADPDHVFNAKEFREARSEVAKNTGRIQRIVKWQNNTGRIQRIVKRTVKQWKNGRKNTVPIQRIVKYLVLLILIHAVFVKRYIMKEVWYNIKKKVGQIQTLPFIFPTHIIEHKQIKIYI